MLRIDFGCQEGLHVLREGALLLEGIKPLLGLAFDVCQEAPGQVDLHDALAQCMA
jgi:hypothetical protein